MAESIPVDNEYLHQIPGRPVREHFKPNVVLSSPMNTPTSGLKIDVGPSPEAAAKGAVN